MNGLIRIAIPDLATFLSAKLPELSADWWQKCVVKGLSFQQQRLLQERGQKTLQQLDFASLLRVLDQNWYELSNAFNLPREGRTWVKELRTARNKWAHLAVDAIPLSDVYRDADTLGRLLIMIGAPQTSLNAVEASKATAVNALANANRDTADALMRKSQKLEVEDFAADFRRNQYLPSKAELVLAKCALNKKLACNYTAARAHEANGVPFGHQVYALLFLEVSDLFSVYADKFIVPELFATTYDNLDLIKTEEWKQVWADVENGVVLKRLHRKAMGTLIKHYPAFSFLMRTISRNPSRPLP